NIVKRRPPENRDPNEEEIEKYKPYLARQIEIINPKIIVPLGRFSMNYFLPLAKITRDQGKLFRVEKHAGGRVSIYILPMLHPAAALRGNEAMKMFKDTFLKLPAALEKVKSGDFGETKEESNKEPAEKKKKIEDVQNKLF
ncbi:MAG: Uracil-DNA glycosylase, partial [Candidatus Nomurabacteria bacterium GW2011_GWB1_43_7]